MNLKSDRLCLERSLPGGWGDDQRTSRGVIKEPAGGRPVTLAVACFGREKLLEQEALKGGQGQWKKAGWIGAVIQGALFLEAGDPQQRASASGWLVC